jgi:hypothetical protein
MIYKAGSLRAREIERLRTKYAAEIRRAIALVQASGNREIVQGPDFAEVYAYPLDAGRIAWGVNGLTGINILRGIRLPDGSDEGVA